MNWKEVRKLNSGIEKQQSFESRAVVDDLVNRPVEHSAFLLKWGTGNTDLGLLRNLGREEEWVTHRFG